MDVFGYPACFWIRGKSMGSTGRSWWKNSEFTALEKVAQDKLDNAMKRMGSGMGKRGAYRLNGADSACTHQVFHLSAGLAEIVSCRAVNS